MTNITDKGSARWQNSKFSPPSDDTLREIVTKMRYCWDRGVVDWAEGQKPYNTSRDGLPGTIRKDGYRYVKLGRLFIPISRIAYHFIHGSWPTGIVRFIDGDPTNFKVDNLLDTGDAQNPLTHCALMKVNEETQRQRQAAFEEARAANQAADGLRFLKYDYKAKLDQEVARLKYAEFGGLRYTTEAEDEKFRAAAIESIAQRELLRDAVDYQLQRMGVKPPADAETAFKLLEALS